MKLIQRTINFTFFSSLRGKKKNYSTSKSTPSHQTEPEFAKRTLVTNDTRDYTVNSDSDDEEPPNFDYLLKLSLTGSHFLLKSEQERFNQDTSSQFLNHFNINTKELSLALKSIPFSERFEIPSIEWSSEELNKMKKDAQVNEDQFQLVLQNNLDRKMELLSVAKKEETPETNQPPSSSIPTANVDNKDKESFQQWLDDILEI